MSTTRQLVWVPSVLLFSGLATVLIILNILGASFSCLSPMPFPIVLRASRLLDFFNASPQCPGCHAPVSLLLAPQWLSSVPLICSMPLPSIPLLSVLSPRSHPAHYNSVSSVPLLGVSQNHQCLSSMPPLGALSPLIVPSAFPQILVLAFSMFLLFSVSLALVLSVPLVRACP